MTDRLIAMGRAAAGCHDIVALGEVMLRLDPGERRIRTARSFDVWEGGGEYNVARALRRVFGLRAAVATALADNEIGRLLEELMLTGGVDTSWVQWRDAEGGGRAVRNGLNFTERGYGLRAPLGVSDRSHTAASQLRPGDIDWNELFAQGVRWFHTGGVFAAHSATTADVAEEAMRAAREHGAVVSYDLNYRASLWRSAGGLRAALETNRRLARFADVVVGVVVGQEGAYLASLGYDGDAADLPGSDAERTRELVARTVTAFPQLSVVATTHRRVTSASRHDWGASGWSSSEGFVEAQGRTGVDILDRVGGGDAFAAGLIFGLMELSSLAEALEYGTAHGALAMTTPGDTSMATLAEVAALAAGRDETRMER